MGVLYDYYRAADDEAGRALGAVVGGPVPGGCPHVVETKGIDVEVRLARLYFEVAGEPWRYDESLARQVLPDEPIGPDNWDQPTVHRLADEVRDRLASVPDRRRDAVAAWWAGTEEFVLDRADPAAVASLCLDLLALCREAAAAGDPVYVWSCL